MRGKQRRDEPMFACVRLEDMVPKGHLLRAVDWWIDFGVVHEKTAGAYSHTGRPSVDPEVLIRMMVMGYLYGITSERRLCQEVHLNLGYRWFCGLSLEDRVPDHSTFTKNRYGRFAGGSLFRDLFCDVVRQAKKHGLVKGKHLTVDATTVKANASLESMEEIEIRYSPEEYVEAVEQQNPLPDEEAEMVKNEVQRLSNQTHRSRTDPEARLLSRPYDRTQLAYSHNVLMDNAERVIVDVEVTEPNLKQEGEVAAEMLNRTAFELGVCAETLGGDKAYGSGEAVRRICEAGVIPHVPCCEQGASQLKGVFPKEDFRYDAEHDEMICPAGKRLRRRTFHRRNLQIEYAAGKCDCRDCVLKPQCTRAPNRIVHRHIDYKFLEYAAVQRTTEAYRWSQRCRKKIEMLFGEAKEFMGLRRARRRGRKNVLEQSLITATVHNIKRIVAVMMRKPSADSAVGSVIFRLSYFTGRIFAWLAEILPVRPYLQTKVRFIT